MDPLILNLIIISICIIALWGGAVWVVESASHIAKRMGVSELVIGLTVVAIATSAPEFAATIVAALEGESAISVGNIVGSNIFNLGIILGLVAIFSAIQINKKMLLRDGLLLLGTSLLLLMFFWDLTLELWEGLILASILVSYVIYLIRMKEASDEEVPTGSFSWMDLPKLILGIAAIITGAKYLVTSATSIAEMFGVSKWIIGITIVGAGTSVPELATSVVALAKGRMGISAGNLIGSDLFNMLGVLGVAAMMRTLTITESDYFSLILMGISMLILLIFMRSGWKISRLEGILLILVALSRWGIAFSQ